MTVNRQPLQTYLQTPVRPAPPVAPPVAQPLYAQPQTQAPAPAPAQLFPPPQQQQASPAASGGLFAAPPLFAATAAAPGSDHLSSLLHTSPSSTPRHSVSVFGENAPPGGAQTAASAPAPAPSTSPNSPQQAAPVRLEQTFDHPLLGASPGLSAAQTPSPPPGAQGLLGSTVLPGPLPGTVGVRSQPGQPARRAGTLPAPLTHGGSSHDLSVTAPSAGMARASPQPSHPHLAAGAPTPDAQAQGQQQQQQLASPSSPDEKLSTLMTALFGGPPPPAKLAAFDVSAVSKDEAGLVALAEKGCWREVLKLAETLLDIPHSSASKAAAATAAAAAAAGEGGAAPAATAHVHTPNTTLAPHLSLRYTHYYIAALVKLKKYDLALQACQSRVGNLFSPDKLYASHPAHYPPAGTAGACPAHVGNMVPFELHMLATELAHYSPGGSGQSRTRLALDQAMKLMQLLRAQIARKRIEEGGSAAAAAASPSPPPPSTPAGESTPGDSKRGSVSDPSGGPLVAPTSGATATATLTSNPFSLTSPHTLSPLSLRQLQSNLSAARLHVVNLCLSFSSPLEVDFEQALAWLAELRDDAPEDPTILHAMARVHLQIGDLATAAALVAQARAAYEALGQPQHVQIGLHQSA